jgi:hypothetical protein
MSDLVWFVYHGGLQTGPFSAQLVREKLDKKEVALDSFLFKAGWKDWRQVSDCLEDLGSNVVVPPPPPVASKAPPRATISGQIIVHNNGQLVIGTGVNISSSGIFIETEDLIFKVGETLKLTCRVKGFAKSFNTEAEVIRFSKVPKEPKGYGLKFTKIDSSIKTEIEKMVGLSSRDLNARGA